VHVTLLALLAAAAVPLGRAPLRLDLAKCPDIDQATLHRVVTMELEAALAETWEDGAVTTATTECTNGHVRLTIDDPVTGKTTTRTVDLTGQPRGLRSRLLGLAIAEATLASWVELQLRPEPPAAEPEVAASPASRREAAHIAERHLQITARAPARAAWEIVAGPGTRWFSSRVLTFVFSGGARRWFADHPSAGVGLEVDGSYGEHNVAEVARATATSLSFAPSLLMRSTFGPVSVTAGAGVRGGLARLSAEPAGLRLGAAGWRAWTGPCLAADLSVPLAGGLFLRGWVEIGYMLVPARGRLGADGVPLIELDGAWLAGLLSLGTRM
jgi:hypothetical protein